MKYIKIIIFQVIVGVLFAFFYTRLTIPKFDNFKLKILDVRGEISFQLPARETYILKIFGDDTPEKVYFNSSRIVHSIFRNRTKLKEFYYMITPEISKQGTNNILIIPDNRYSIKIMNNIVSTDFGAVLFKSSVEKKPKNNGMPYLLAALLFVSWGLAVIYFLKYLFGLSVDNFPFKYYLSYFLCILLLVFFDKISLLLPVRLLFFERSYIGVVAFLILIFQIPTLFNFIVHEIVYRYHRPEPSIKPKLKSIRPLNIDYPRVEYKRIYLEFLKISGKNVSRQFLGCRAVAWFLRNDFSDKCILFFMALLFSCAFLLCFNLSFIAEFLANVAYLSLVTGVIIKLKNAESKINENRPA